MLNERADQSLLKVYQKAYDNAQYFHDTNDKLQSFDEVVRFCSDLPECAEDTSLKKSQVLFWTYHQMGDLMVEKKDQIENRLQALTYYQNALSYAQTNEDMFEILSKIRFIYQDFNDLKNVVETSEKMVRLIDDAFKVEAFLKMASESQNAEQEAYFLEQALKYVSDEKISFLKQCRKTLNICERLLEIYEKVGKQANALHIKELQSKTKRLLH